MLSKSLQNHVTRFFAALTIVVMLTLNFSVVGPRPAYAASNTMTDLGTLGGSYSLAFEINAAGQVVGESSIAADASDHAFVWDSVGGMIDLGTLGGSYSQARAINNEGQIVGSAGTAEDAGSHAFIWDSVGGMTDLGTLGGNYSSAFEINEAGQVVGIATTAGDASYRAFIWDSVEGMTDLGTLGGIDSWAQTINEAGQVVGYAYVTGSAWSHAFVWDSVGGMTDLGTLGGNSSEALAINEAGQVVGSSTIEGDVDRHAFIWDSAGGMIDLGTLGGSDSVAMAINEAGQVVGRSLTPGNTVWHAFIWDRVAGMTDLGTLGGSDSQAFAINDSGQVVGNANTAENAGDHAFVWDSVEGMTDLGTLGGIGSQSLAINEAGQVVGISNMEGDVDRHAFIAKISSSDTTPPDTTIDNSPSNPSNSNTASFSFSGTDSGIGVASFECSLDSAMFAPCMSPQSYNALSDGLHTFQVSAIDGTGNVDSTPASYTWIIDTIPLNVSNLTSIGSSCSQFNLGSAATLSQLQYAVNKGKVTAISPGVFVYWVKVNAVAGNNTFTIDQTITTGNYDNHFFSQSAGSAVYGSDCMTLKAKIGTSNGVTTVSFKTSSAGTYILAVKYNATSVKGFRVPDPTTVHYNFSTTGVPGSTQGLDLVKP